MSKEINLQEILTFTDLKNGFKKLRKKNKYKDYNSAEFIKRYIKITDKKENKLYKFLNCYLNVDREIDEDALREFYEKLVKYSFSPYNAFAIEKGKEKPRKYRPLLVPEPKDRLIFDALLPVYFKKLKICLIQRNLLGLGLSKNQRISDVLHKIYEEYVSNGFVFALTLDYSSFFSLIDREMLIKKISIDLNDDGLLLLLRTIIYNDVENGKEVQEKTGVKILENGIPQGLSFSPLLACYYALEIDDVYINDRAVVGFRYIDDIIIFGKTKEDLEKVYEKIKIKSEELKMRLHPLGDKTELKNLVQDHIKYLGVEISTNGLKISEEKFNDLLEIAKNEIFHIGNIEKKDPGLIKEVYYSFIKGWLNHYEKIIKKPHDLYEKIDKMLLDKYFGKNRARKSFYTKNPWIKLLNNSELRK